ncbi:VirB4-like conjugal transfer ATPase, CD1110 family [Eggerthella lenta]|uniref:VirB4-like conjugal transfer ATPase, CD1110 family n=1 Tax=Eggerthella lenta TaxID=84112 RepID=UPI001E3E5CB6|nr:conjugal transfer protein TraC [Eggerthella lenta]MDB1756725.1 conjugal transfer protein TraC [Eggerthella lenta]MDB1763315.1 conjugal transfer protein TraC [Eggerthella lenta]
MSPRFVKKKRKAADEQGRKGRRKRAGNVAESISYKALFRDGVAMNDFGTYSRTYRFGDISYQSASNEAQAAICKRMRMLYNGLTPDVCMQMTLVNRPIHDSEIGNRTFFEVRDDTTGPLAAEYNDILNAKMLEGVSNLVRERYITFAVEAQDAERAVPMLARMRSMASSVLTGIRSDVVPLDGSERTRLIHSILRPGEPPLSFDWSELSAHRGTTTKDLVSPNLMDLKPDGCNDKLTVDGVWCQVMSFRRFESNLSDRCLADMVDLPIPLIISTHIRALEQNKALAFVKQRLNWIDKEVVEDQMSAVKKGYDYTLLPAELRYTRDEAQDMFDRLKDDSQHLFRYSGLAMTYAPSREELEDQVMRLVSTAQTNGIELAPLCYRQLEGLNSILPLGANQIDVERYMLTDEIAIQSPFATLELNQEGGGYYGQNRHSLNLVIANRKKLASPMGFVGGKPGSGKSFQTKREITNTRLAYPGDEIIILDPAQEFGPTTVACGGRHVRLSPDSGNFLNPMVIADVTHQSEQLQIASKTEALIALCGASMADGDERQTDAERSIASRCFKQALAKAQEEGREMLIGDVHEELKHQPDPEARFIALRLERYVDGALSIFNHPSNVEFDNPMMCFSFRDLPDSMRAFGMVAALEFIRNRMYRNFDRGVTTWLYVDEVQGLFGHPATISYLSRLWAEGRKFGLIATGITQNATYLLDNPQGRTLILNSDFLMLFKQSLTDGEKWRELLNLSEQELGYIDDSVKPGEGLLIAGAARVPIVDDWPRGRLYDLWNTKADEIAALKRAGASDGS